MAGLRYDDYRVTLTPRADGGYDAVGVGADGMEHRGTLRLPFDDAGLERAVLRVAGRAARGPTRDVGGTAAPDINAEVLGAALAGALLAADVAAGYDAARDRAAAAGRGLRLTLSLGAAPALLSVPWELLYRPPTFLANQRQTPVVRHLDVDRLPEPPAVDGPVRILGVVANPPDTPPLDVAAERARVERAIAGVVELGRVELDWLSPATPRRLREMLRDGTYHVLHYVGHGDFTPDGEGVLFLEQAADAGGHTELDAAELASLLADQTSLRLVVLNACDGARTSLTDPFAGVATTLVQLGVPAVVAMQFAISDAAAILFAEELYTNLIASQTTIDAAVSEARKAIFVEQGSVEWATPVLYLADPDAELFRFAVTPEHETETAPDPGPEPRTDPAPEATAATAPVATARPGRRRAGTAIVGGALLVLAVVVGLVVKRATGEGDAAAGTTTVATVASTAVTTAAPPAAVALTAPVQFLGSIDAVGGQRRHEFDAVAGQHLYVQHGPVCNADLDYRVLGPSDELVSLFDHQACLDTDRFLAPATGRYTLVVDSSGVTGAYDLTVLPIRPDRDAVGTMGARASGTIDGAGAQDRVTFDLRAGDLVYVDGLGACGASSVKYDLLDAQGNSELGLGYPVCQDAGRTLITADGQYDLLVYSDQGGIGPYSILLTPIRPNGGGPLAAGGIAEGDIRPAGAWDEWTFDAPAGSTVTLTPQGECVDGLKFDVYAPGTGASELGFGHRTCDLAGPYVVSTDGPHTMRVYGENGAVGPYSLVLTVEA